MKLYLAGKITGLEYEEAESAFMWAETVVEKAGHTALNPLTMVDQTDDGREWADYMVEAVMIVLTMAEGLYMLPNWRDSQGARVEHAIAVEMKMPIFYAASELPIGSDWPEVVSGQQSAISVQPEGIDAEC